MIRVTDRDANACKPPVRDTRYRRGHDFPTETQCLTHPHPTQIGDANAPILDLKLIVTDGETVMDALLAEPGIFRPFSETIHIDDESIDYAMVMPGGVVAVNPRLSESQ